MFFKENVDSPLEWYLSLKLDDRTQEITIYPDDLDYFIYLYADEYIRLVRKFDSCANDLELIFDLEFDFSSTRDQADAYLEEIIANPNNAFFMITYYPEI